ncbi:MAG: SLC13 family permease [Gemmatimonadota bacterium]
MTLQLTAIGIFIAAFAIAGIRRVHLGVTMFAVACAAGVVLARMPVTDVVGGFPISIMILLAGVTYFFGIAQENDTVDRLLEAALGRVGHIAALLPFVFFALTAALSAMGSPIGSLVICALAMPVARKNGIDPILMGIAIGTGQSAGGFAPTSLFGIVTYGTAHQANIPLNPLVLFAVGVVTNVLLISVAFLMFGGSALLARRSPAGRAAMAAQALIAREQRGPWQGNQVATVACMIGLVVAVIAGALSGRNPDIGVLCFIFGAALALVDPKAGSAAVRRIDWSTVLLIGGVITFVGVLQEVGSVDLLGRAASAIGEPIVAALVLCAIGGLVSAFASTTGILAALIPLALPLVASGSLPGWALISALGLCSSVVDVSPYSTTGATVLATAHEDDRPRLRAGLMRWGMSMVVIGPLLLVGLLVVPAMR